MSSRTRANFNIYCRKYAGIFLLQYSKIGIMKEEKCFVALLEYTTSNHFYLQFSLNLLAADDHATVPTV